PDAASAILIDPVHVFAGQPFGRAGCRELRAAQAMQTVRARADPEAPLAVFEESEDGVGSECRRGRRGFDPAVEDAIQTANRAGPQTAVAILEEAQHEIRGQSVARRERR